MSDFTPEGYKEFPGLIPDAEDLVPTIAEMRYNEKDQLEYRWPTDVLEQRLKQYGYFLQEKPMPRARAKALWITSHIFFEVAWRRHMFSDLENLDARDDVRG